MDNRTTTRELILYIANRHELPTWHTILKLLYFADLQHLEHYGSLMVEETYTALQYGPVARGAYLLMSEVRDGYCADSTFSVYYQQITRGGKTAPVVKPLRDADLDELSDSMVECLDDAIRRYQHCNFDQLTELSHDEVWHAAWKQGAGTVMPVEHMARMIGDPDLIEYLNNPHPDFQGNGYADV